MADRDEVVTGLPLEGVIRETTAAAGGIAVVPAPQPAVSIVVVTYGTGPVVLDAVAAIVEHTPAPFELLVVDNPHPERPATGELLRTRTSGVELITPDRNLGFGGGNDLAAQVAAAEVLCLLNPDAIVTEGWLEPLVAALDDPVVGVAGPVFVDPDGTLQEAGQLIHDDGCTAAVGGPEVLTGDWSQAFSRDVDYVSAACWVVRRAEHLARGGFDERYRPAFFEDADYALRVEADGQRSRLVADVPLVHHRGSGGAGRVHQGAEASQQVFRSVWAERLRGQPSRPTSDAESVVNRDRLAGERVVWIDRSGVGPDREAGLAAATADAAAHPRDRVTFLTPSLDGLDEDTLIVARRAGVETVAGDVDGALAERDFTDRCEITPAEGSLPAGPDPVAAAGAPPPSPAWLAAVALVGLAGLVLRVLVLRSPAGFLNADEAYTGIQSFEILAGDFPVVLGGAVYTLPLESYLYAPFVAAFGAHILPLKLLSVLFWLVAGLLVALLATRLDRRRTGLIAAALFWITPGGMLLLSTTAYAAYASGMVVTLAAFWMALRIVDDEPHDWVLGLFGAAAGFGFWLHPMYSATLLPMVAFVLWVRRTPRSWAWVVGGGVVGAGPFLAWNLVHGFPSLESPIDHESSYFDRLGTFATDLMPRAFGLRDGALAWELGAVLGLLLYAALIAVVGLGLVSLVRSGSNPGRYLLPVVLVAAFPIMAVFENLFYAADGRYGVITYPFLVVAAALGAGALLGPTARRAMLVAAGGAAVWVLGFVLPGLVSLVDDTDGDPNAATSAVVDRLDEAGIVRIAGSYWAVHPVDFVADRRIEAAVTPGYPIRLPNRQRAVEGSPPEAVAFVFRVEDDDPARLWLGPDAYTREQIGGYVLYLPR